LCIARFYVTMLTVYIDIPGKVQVKVKEIHYEYLWQQIVI
jgi:hypothetical protein